MPTSTAISAATPDLAALEIYATRGDPRAFEVLTFRYRDMVLATCYRTLRSMADAEDATQETFLKLAQHARDVRSNAAAWLHATAVRTSLDLLRRKGARDRAVTGAAEQMRHRSRDLTQSDREGLRVWADVEPIIDAALAKLNDADRTLIVERFLAGRSQVDLAAEAGVNPGTLSRRLDSAIERLRGHLQSGGLAIGAGAAALALMAAPSSVQASPALAASLGKIGLSQMASGSSVAAAAGSTGGLGSGSLAAATVVGTKLPVLAGVAAVLLAGGLGVWMFSGPTGPAQPAVTLPGAVATDDAAKAGGFDRPSAKVGTGSRMIDDSQLDGSNGTFRFDGNKVVFGIGTSNDFKIVYDIVRCDPPGPKARLEIVCVEINKPAEAYTSNKVGDKLEGVWSVDGRVFVVSDEKSGRNMYAVRPHAGVKLANKAPAKAEGNDPALVGDWIGLNEVGLYIDNENIAFGSEQWIPENFKIISWEKTDAFAKVEVIRNAGNSDADRKEIGKRFKMLIRRDASGNSVVTYNTLASGKNNEWPAGFDEKYLTANPPGSVAPKDGQRTVVFSKGKP